MPTDELIGLTEAAALIGMATTSLRNYVTRRHPRLPTVRIGNKHFTTRAAVMEWDAARKAGQGDLAPLSDPRLTLAQAAKIAGLTAVTMRAYAEGRLQPVLPTEWMGSARVVDPDALQAWINERRSPG